MAIETIGEPIFLENEDVKRILNEVIAVTPLGYAVYLRGGALRNAIYFRLFREKMTQRDFDITVIGEKKPFVESLLAIGFVLGKKNTATAVVLKKPRHANPSEDFDDWVYLDCMFRPGGNIADDLKRHVNFTINGAALELKLIHDPEWYIKIVTLPSMIDDLKAKQLRTNARFPINAYACVRFVSRGFQPPPREEIDLMVNDLANLSEEDFVRDSAKVISYVGSAEEVRKIASRIGIPFDILDLRAIQDFRTHGES